MKLKIHSHASGSEKVFEMGTLEDLAFAVEQLAVPTEIFDGIDTEDLEAGVKALAEYLSSHHLEAIVEQ